MQASGNTFYVATSGPGNLTPGGSCASAGYVGTGNGTVSLAVDDAAPGDTIVICNGTYSFTAPVLVNTAVTFRGESTAGTVIDGGDLSRLFTSSSTPKTDYTLSGMTLRRGKGGLGTAPIFGGNITVVGSVVSDNANPGGSGGAISTFNTVTVVDSRFERNSAGSGGAIWAQVNVSVANSQFTGNGAGGDGGAIYCYCTAGYYSQTVVVTDSTFTDNTSGAEGGAIHSSRNIAPTDSSFVRNVAARGGALWVGFGSSPIVRTSFIGNRATTGVGGAVRSNISGVTATGSEFSGNTASGAGGAISAVDNVTVGTSIFTANASSQNGGAIQTDNSITVTDVTFGTNVSGAQGGAIRALANATITRGVFTDNSAATAGGAVYAGGSVWATSASFARNGVRATSAQGGAIWAAANATITSSDFTSNSAVDTDGGDPIPESSGGSVYINGSGTVTVTSSTFTGDRADGYGGSIHAPETGNGLVTVTGTTFRDAGAALGGAIMAPRVTATTSSFIDNTAFSGGGAIYGTSTITTTNSLFRGNAAVDTAFSVFGGAILGLKTVDMVGSTFTGNDAPIGGAVVGGAVGFPVRVVNSTFSGNTASFGPTTILGQGLEMTNGTVVEGGRSPGAVLLQIFETTRITDSIVAGGSCTFSSLAATGANFRTHSGCPGVQKTASELKLRPLGDYGGPTPTVALGSGSVAIDPVGSASTQSVDQRGRARPFGARSDAGAYEARIHAVAPTSGGSGDPACTYASIAAAVAAAGAGDTIHLCTGTHTLTAGVTINADGLTVEGEGSAGTIVEGAGFPILSAFEKDVSLADLTLRNGAGVFGGGALWADDVSIARVRFQSNSSAGAGGAVSASGTVEVEDSLFEDNSSGGFATGGAVSAFGTVTVSGSRFLRNHAGFGGAIHSGYVVTIPSGISVSDSEFLQNGSLSRGGALHTFGAIVSAGSVFEENTAGMSGIVGPGGAVYAFGSITSTLDAFRGNEALDSGGAIFSRDADVSTWTGVFVGNVAGTGYGGAISAGGSVRSGSGTYQDDGAPYGGGGAIHADAHVTSNEDIFSRTAGLDGGAILAYDGVTVIRSEFDSATAGYRGGAISSLGGDVSVSDGQFTANQAVSGNGGAIYAQYGWVSITDGVFVENTSGSASGLGGAVYVMDAGYSNADGDALVVTRGYFEGNVADAGGALASEGAISVSDASFVANRSSSGGAIYTNGSVAIRDGTFTENVSSGSYGAVYGQAALTVDRATFHGNRADGGSGGAIGGGSSLMRAESASFTDNHAQACGGAIEADGPFEGSVLFVSGNAAATGAGGAVCANDDVTVEDADFSANTAGGSGGAIYAQDVDLSGGSFIANSSNEDGGAVHATGTLAVRRTSFDGNAADGSGGTLYVAGTSDIRATTIADGSSGIDGGALWAGDQVNTFNATFHANVATRKGGAIYGVGNVVTSYTTFVDDTAGAGNAVYKVFSSVGNAIEFRNTLLAGADGAENCVIQAPLTAIDYNGNVDTGGDCYAIGHSSQSQRDVSRASLKLQPFGYYGGATRTVALGRSSVARDLTNAPCLEGVDQRGVARPIGTKCDSGAIEGDDAGTVSSVRVYSSTGVELTAGIPSISTGDRLTVVMTITGRMPLPSGMGFHDPVGTISLNFCYDASSPSFGAPPIYCMATGEPVASGETSGGTDATDGVSTARIANWSPPSGAGWYLLTSTYLSDGFYANSGSTGDFAHQLVRVVDYRTTVTGRIGVGGVEVTGGIPVASTGDRLTLTGTVSGRLPNPSGVGLLDPSAGSTSFFACFSAVAPPTQCVPQPPAEVLGSNPPDLGQSLTDGIVRTSIEYTPSSGAGWYLFGIEFLPDGGSLYESSRTSGDATYLLVRVGDASTATRARLSAPGGIEVTAGSPSVTTGDTIANVATVRGFFPQASGGGLLDPTSGTVRFYVCADATTKTSCTSGDGWVAVGSPVSLSSGTSATDGIATATMPAWDPGGLEGTFLFAAVYDPGAGRYRGSSSTGDVTYQKLVVQNGVPVVVTSGGPWRVTAASSPATVELTAGIVPAIAGCQLRFDISTNSVAGGSTTISATVTTDASGVARRTGASLPFGAHTVTIRAVGGTCRSSNVQAATIAVTPASVTVGSVGGGVYRLGGALDRSSNSFATYVSVATRTVPGPTRRSTVTLTDTEIRLAWLSMADNSSGGVGWRLDASTSTSSSTGSTAWTPIKCPRGSGALTCGSFTGTGMLRALDALGAWVTVAPSIAYTVTVYDGGLSTCSKRVANCVPTELPDQFSISVAGFSRPLLGAALPQVSYAVGGTLVLEPTVPGVTSLRVF